MASVRESELALRSLTRATAGKAAVISTAERHLAVEAGDFLAYFWATQRRIYRIPIIYSPLNLQVTDSEGQTSTIL